MKNTELLVLYQSYKIMEKKLKNAIIMNRLTKIMFVLGFLLTSVWSYSSNSVYAQNQKFSFEFKQTSIKTIFQYIEKHSEFLST